MEAMDLECESDCCNGGDFGFQSTLPSPPLHTKTRPAEPRCLDGLMCLTAHKMFEGSAENAKPELSRRETDSQ